MGYHFRGHDGFVRIVELTPGMRKQIEATIENLLSVLDHFDGDENVEDDASGEPCLGWTDMEGRYNLFHPGDGREQEDEHDEDGGDAEPEELEEATR